MRNGPKGQKGQVLPPRTARGWLTIGEHELVEEGEPSAEAKGRRRRRGRGLAAVIAATALAAR